MPTSSTLTPEATSRLQSHLEQHRSRYADQGITASAVDAENGLVIHTDADGKNSSVCARAILDQIGFVQPGRS